MDVEITQHNSDGYKALVHYGDWRVAILNKNEQATVEGLSYLEGHMETDEVFVLLDGEAVLLTAGSGDSPEEALRALKMEKNKLFNVKKAVWHAVLMSNDAKILIVEDRDTAPENTRYSDITASQKEQIKKIDGLLSS